MVLLTMVRARAELIGLKLLVKDWSVVPYQGMLAPGWDVCQATVGLHCTAMISWPQLAAT
jgi:hypothetical protein